MDLETLAENINIEAILAGGTSEFYFAEGARSRAESITRGFLKIGNVSSVTPQTEQQDIQSYVALRGKRRRAKKTVIEHSLSYEIECNQHDLANLAILFGADSGTGFTQAALAEATVDDLVFTPTAPSVAGVAVEVEREPDRHHRLTDRDRFRGGERGRGQLHPVDVGELVGPGEVGAGGGVGGCVGPPPRMIPMPSGASVPVAGRTPMPLNPTQPSGTVRTRPSGARMTWSAWHSGGRDPGRNRDRPRRGPDRPRLPPRGCTGAVPADGRATASAPRPGWR